MADFTVMWSYRDRPMLEDLGAPKTIPMHLMLEREQRVKRNHQQTVARLQQRGGLSVRELVAVFEDTSVFVDGRSILRLSLSAAVARLKAALAAAEET